MKSNNNKGQTDILVTVLLVLIALAVVAIVAFFVIHQVKSGISEADLKSKNFEIYAKKAEINNGILVLTLERGSSTENFTGLKIVMTANGKSQTYDWDGYLNPIETQVLSIPLTGDLITAGSILVDGYPVVLVNSVKEIASKSFGIIAINPNASSCICQANSTVACGLSYNNSCNNPVCGKGIYCSSGTCNSTGSCVVTSCVSTGCAANSTITCGQSYLDNCGTSCGKGTKCSSGTCNSTGNCVASCIPNSSCIASNVCVGSTCSNGTCGTISGTKAVDNSCQANTCIGSLCTNNCGTLMSGTKTCFAGGDGSSGSPYQITSWTQLNNIRYTNLNFYYVLMNNLSSSTSGYSGLGNNWTPIGNQTSGWQFTGNFNGNNNTISDLKITLPSTTYVGLFGLSGGTISNIGLINVNITGYLAVGGLVGWQFPGTISNSYSTGSVSGYGYVGGLVGQFSGGNGISNSYSTANVSGSFGGVGGLVGSDTAPISNSYSTGSVTGDSTVGGLVGVTASAAATISNSYSTGSVNGSSYVGGLVGQQQSGGTISNSYWDTQTSGQSTSAGGIGKTTAQMKTLSTFTGGGWNIVSGTPNPNNGYPYLSWQVGNSASTWRI